jgi:PPOX class probable FMN-dependent enzyme
VSHTDPYTISSPDQLYELVGHPLERVITKELPALDDRATAFISVSPFLVMATTGADGSSDASPKGGPAGFVRVLGPTRLLVPEFPGNRRFDGAQNLVERPGIGLLFVVPGISETLRVNGFARLTRDPDLLDACAVDGRRPWFAADIEVRQAFSHCAKAFLRSELWKPESWPADDAVASPSRIIGEQAKQERRRDSEVRREVEAAYRPELY